MAEKRMFAKTIIDSDAFLDMSLSAQALYFHLSMRGDDDGFINNPKKIQRMIGCNDDDLKLLIAKKFIIPFDSGIVVIKHWKIHNYIQKDRYKPTVYQEEAKQLETKPNKAYKLLDTEWIQNGYTLETQIRIDKNRLDKNRLDKSSYIVEILDYLNNKAATNFKYHNKKTKSLIEARLNEKFTIEDFYTVIDKKCDEWIGTDFEKFIRPETLFSNKFESYLNQKVSKPQDKFKNTIDEFLQDEEGIF